jgi:micrococcal nuclease
MTHRHIRLIILVAVVVMSAVVGVLSPTHNAPSTSVASTTTQAASATSTNNTYPIVRVVDGDTIVIKLDGKDVKVRLIGINTPETVDPRRPVQCFGKEASDKAKSTLTPGTLVDIETDPSQDTHDKYGRLLAYVFLPDGSLFNEYMVAEGYAYEYTYHVPYKYQKEFKAAQASAQAAGKGLWAPGTCGH